MLYDDLARIRLVDQLEVSRHAGVHDVRDRGEFDGDTVQYSLFTRAGCCTNVAYEYIVDAIEIEAWGTGVSPAASRRSWRRGLRRKVFASSR